MNFEEEYNSPVYCKILIDKITENMEKIGREVRFMEVCGTHTAALFHTGLRSLLPKNLFHISGPGCPVCVTHEDEVERFIALAELDNIILATFGDLIRVPNGEGKSLKNAELGKNSRVEIVYSPQDALNLAEKNLEHTVIFLGIGFETTAPIIAATILQARARELKNFTVYSMHKKVAPALDFLLNEADEKAKEKTIDIFLLPGHVACITGVDYFDFIVKSYKKPAIIGGFDAVDLAYALNIALEQLIENKPQTVNAYKRVVKDKGNPKALEILNKVFEVKDSYWRGLGKIPQSALCIREEFADFDSLIRFPLNIPPSKPTACQCGSVLKGYILPTECPLFKKVCNPQNPLGPCMVSSEGACSTYHKNNF